MIHECQLDNKIGGLRSTDLRFREDQYIRVFGLDIKFEPLEKPHEYLFSVAKEL